MKTIALDTNAIIDYLLARPGFENIKTIFTRANAGVLTIFIPLPAILEVEWTLKRYYQIPKDKVIKWLEAIVLIPNCFVPDKHIVLESIKLHRESSGVSLNDCLIAIFAKHAKVDEFITSDQKLQRLYKKLTRR